MSDVLSIVIGRGRGCQLWDVTVHSMADHPADQSWANTVMEAKHMPSLHSVSVGSKQAPLALRTAAGDFKWAYAVTFTGHL